jgi:hypothetical protein
MNSDQKIYEHQSMLMMKNIISSHNPNTIQKDSNEPISLISDFRTWKLSSRVHLFKVRNLSYKDAAIRKSSIQEENSEDEL